jgi:transcriptional regulator with XRE-family HTH domain
MKQDARIPQKEFGRLVAALRREHMDEQGNVWSQDELAKQTGLPKETIANIEIGRKKLLSTDILLQLAEAFNLTSDERMEFFLAANRIEEQQIAQRTASPQAVLNNLIQTLERTYAPAYIIDTYCDLLAVNMAALRFYSVAEEHATLMAAEPARMNMLSYVFSPEWNKQDVMAEQDWKHYAYANMTLFRTYTLRFRSTPYFASLLSQMLRWPLFKRYWQDLPYTESDYSIDSEYVRMCSPDLGPVSCYSTMYRVITRYGYLLLVTNIPTDARTAQVVYDLVQQGGTQVHCFAPWPEKDLLD